VCISVLCQLFCLIFTTEIFEMAAISERTAAIYVLILVLAALLAAVDLYLALPLSDFYQDQQMRKRRADRLRREEAEDLFPRSKEHVEVCSCPLVAYINLAAQSAITFLVFPFIYQEVSYPTFGSVSLFPVVFSFLPHALVYTGGGVVAALAPSPPAYCANIALLRLIFVPLFLLADTGTDDRLIPVVLWDWSYTVLVFVWSFIGGYSMSVAAVKTRSAWMMPVCLFGCLSGSVVCLSLHYSVHNSNQTY